MSKKIKSNIKKFLPRILLKYYRLIYYFFIQNKFKGMNNREIFSMIYRKNMWGDSKDKKKFHSGFGSRNNKIIDGFILNVNNFITNLSYKPTILDIGCGYAKESGFFYVKYNTSLFLSMLLLAL